LLSDISKTFKQISPITTKDLEVAKVADKENIAPGSTTVLNNTLKRKRTGNDTQKPRHGLVSLQILKPVLLTIEQKQVLDIVLNGHSVFFTGSAGTGKSHLLRRIVASLPPDVTFVTASTGIAACHIGGTTLHSFAGIGSGTAALNQCIELAKRQGVQQQWKKCRHLVIDEISMVDGEFFEKMENVARVVRGNNKPFGGIQLILCGDFLQLPPVSKGGKKTRFCFQTEAWSRAVTQTLQLKQVHRQSDPAFIKILNHVRYGSCTDAMLDKLLSTGSNNVEKLGIVPTRLCTHNEDVELINKAKLDALQGCEKLFNAVDSDAGLSHLLDQATPVATNIKLKVGAQVMLTKNMDVSRGLVNGARGVVAGFDPGQQGLPIVRFLSGEKLTVHNEKWGTKHAGLYVVRRQLPLKLAWAISIHKSQGMTLDCVEMSLSRVFEYGQAYVALSRAKSMDGLRVLDVERRAITANPDVIRFYAQVRAVNRLQHSSSQME